MTYRVGLIEGATPEALAASLRNELQRLAVSLAQPQDYLALRTLYAEPTRIFDGMVVKADGSTWNPGSGAGVYVYSGSAWVKL